MMIMSLSSLFFFFLIFFTTTTSSFAQEEEEEQQQTTTTTRTYIRGGNFQHHNTPSSLSSSSSQYDNWLQNYIHFHRQERNTNNPEEEEEGESTKYLVLDYDKNGSLERNLLYIPYHLWLAYKTNRVFVLGDTWQLSDTRTNNNDENKNNEARYYSCGLEHIWKPNQLDWTMPRTATIRNTTTNDMVQFLLYQTSNSNSESRDMDHHHQQQLLLLSQQHDHTRIIRMQGNPDSFVLGLGKVLQEEEDESSKYDNESRQVFQHIYQAMFTLQEPVQQIMHTMQEELGLTTKSDNQEEEDNYDNSNNNNYIAVYLNTPVNLLKANADASQQMTNDAAAAYVRKVQMEQHSNFEKVVQRTKLLNGQSTNGDDDNIKLYCAGIDGTNTLPDCINHHHHHHHDDTTHNDNNSLKRYAEEFLNDGGNNKCTAQYAPQIVDLYLAAQASCIGFGDDDAGLAATLFGRMECYSIHDLNPSIIAAAQRWDSPFYPNPSGRASNTQTTTTSSRRQERQQQDHQQQEDLPLVGEGTHKKTAIIATM